MLAIAGVTVLQSIAFANLAAGDPPIYCRFQTRWFALMLLAAFGAGYHVLIEFCAGVERDYRQLAGVDIGALAGKSRNLCIGVNIITSLSEITVFSLVAYYQPDFSLCG